MPSAAVRHIMKNQVKLILFLLCTLSITSKAQINATYSTTDLLCFNDSTGQIEVTPSTGTPPYQYKINTGTWQTSNLFVGLAAGLYKIYVQDSLGLIDSSQLLTLTQPTVAAITAIAVTPPSCGGLCDGSFQVSASGGTPPYKFAFWPPPYIFNTNGLFTSVCPGTHSILIEDNNGCIDLSYAGMPANVSMIITPISGQSCNTGAFQINTLGGVPPFSFSSSGGGLVTINSNNQVSSSTVGTFTIMVVDATGVVTFTPANIVQNIVTNVGLLGFDPCEATPSFELIANVYPPNGSYSYNWFYNGSATSFSSQDTTAVLSSYGSYILEVTDTNGCVHTATRDILAGSLFVSASADTVCQGETVNLVATSNGNNILAQWYPQNIGATSVSAVVNTSTSYTAVVNDPNFCVDTVVTTVVVRDTNFSSNLTFVPTPPSCTHAADGSIHVISVPSSNALQYSWNTSDTSAAITALLPGSYSVLVSEGGSCVYKTFNLPATNTNCGTLEGRVVADTNADCLPLITEPGISNVEISVAPLNITALTNATGNYVITGVPFGTYTISQSNLPMGAIAACNNSQNVLLNANNISAIADFVDTVNQNVNHFIYLSGATCTMPLIPTAKYINYALSTPNLSSAATVYAVFDSISHFGISIPSPAYIIGDTVFWNVTMNSTLQSIGFEYVLPPTMPMGTILPLTCGILNTQLPDLNTFDNTNSYNYVVCTSYDPNDKQVSPNGLTSAGYVRNTDSVFTYTLNFQNTGTAPAVTVEIRDTLSANLNEATLNVVDASHVYNVMINNGNAVSFKFPNIMLPDSNSNEPLSHGHITYQIRTKPYLSAGTVINNTGAIYFDYNAPVITNTTVNTIYAPLSGASAVGTANTLCNSICGSGKIVVDPNNGVAPFSYSIVPNCGAVAIIGDTIKNLLGGTYTIVASDVLGETVIVNATIADPVPITMAASTSDILCYGDSSTVSVTASGGTGTLSNEVNGAAVGNVFIAPAGNYTLVATDAYNCSTSNSISITQPPLLSISNLGYSTVGAEAALSANISGGVGSYTYNLLMQVNNTWVLQGTFSALPITANSNGNYMLVAIDSNGCQVSDTITVVITSIDGQGSTLATYASPNPFNEIITVSLPTTLPMPAVIEMYDATGKRVFSTSASSKKLLIDTRQFASGVYWLKIGEQTIKMVK
jgi:uncharacterized repeat protein (TIGR01451 family)